MLRVHVGTYVPKYHAGNWYWNDEFDEIQFNSYYENIMEAELYIWTGGFKFLKTMNQIEELIFRQEFQRDDNTYDADVILVQDIINLVLFLAPTEIVTKKFVHFLRTSNVLAFVRMLVIYFEHYLKLVEFLLIRRDEISGNMPRMQSQESIKIKQIYSSRLMQYRLLLAREYSKILLGEGKMQRFHHYNPNLHISQTLRDRAFHEGFLALCTQIVWVAMHRRAYQTIEMEMDRLFRSEHFTLHTTDELKLTEAERKVLYGKKYKRVNYRAQNSPVIQEIANVSNVDLPILWIGEQKYRGTDLRIHELEMEFLVRSSQLVLINATHGILGHPKKLYNTLLQLDHDVVRKHYSKEYDPYNLVSQPRLQIPKLDEETIRQNAKHYEAFFKIVEIFELWDMKMVKKWINRDDIIEHFKTKGMLTDIFVKCSNALAEETLTSNVDQITQQFMARMEKLHKKKQSKSIG